MEPSIWQTFRDLLRAYLTGVRCKLLQVSNRLLTRNNLTPEGLADKV